MKSERGQRLLVTILVYRRKVRDAISLAIIRDDSVDERNKQVLGIFRSTAREVGTEGVQN